MRLKLLSLITFIFVLSLESNAQVLLNTNPYWEGEVTFTNGSKEKGLIKLPHIPGVRKISFKTNENSKSKKLKRKEITSLKVKSPNGRNYIFEFLPVVYSKKNDRHFENSFLLVEAKNNYATFYSKAGEYVVSKKTDELVLLEQYNMANDFPMFIFFIKKRDDEKAYMLARTGDEIGLNKTLKNGVAHYLTEDQELIKDVENGDYKHTQIPEVIQRYLETTNNL